MPETDDLRATLTTAITIERQPLLEHKLAEVQRGHEAEITAAVDKALAAIRGKGKVKPKQPRKPRKDKGTPRLGRGMPKAPAESEVTP